MAFRMEMIEINAKKENRKNKVLDCVDFILCGEEDHRRDCLQMEISVRTIYILLW